MRKKPWLLAGLVLTGAAWMIWNQQMDAKAHDIFEDHKLVVGTTGIISPLHTGTRNGIVIKALISMSSKRSQKQQILT